MQCNKYFVATYIFLVPSQCRYCMLDGQVVATYLWCVWFISMLDHIQVWSPTCAPCFLHTHLIKFKFPYALELNLTRVPVKISIYLHVLYECYIQELSARALVCRFKSPLWSRRRTHRRIRGWNISVMSPRILIVNHTGIEYREARIGLMQCYQLEPIIVFIQAKYGTEAQGYLEKKTLNELPTHPHLLLIMILPCFLIVFRMFSK